MELEFKISKTVNRTPYNMLLYSEAGTGKTSLAAQSEKPFFLAIEKGSEFVQDVGRFTDNDNNQIIPQDYQTFIKMLQF